MIRRIVEIDEEKCTGCGLCAKACHEGAIAMINGKAKLLRDDYCDGLGNCLPHCPTNAITFVEREAAAFDEKAVAAAQLQKRAGLEDKTMDYLAAYKYGADLIRKLATMKQFARFGQNSKGCVQRGHSLIHDNIFDNKTVPKHSETAQKFPLRPYLLRQNFGCWENEKTLKLQ